MPLAYFLTFTTYGVWLHGQTIGSVDKEHNEPGTPFLTPDPIHEALMRGNMSKSVYLLNSERRTVVLDTIQEVARYRDWRVLACHVRTNHVHIVVVAEAKPEKVMSDFKAYASRRLRERLGEPADCKRWTQHGSTRYLWSEEQVAGAIAYTVDGQGETLAVFDGRGAPSSSESSSEPPSEPPSEPEA